MNIGAKILNNGLPWWRSGWGSTCQCRGHGFRSWPGRIPCTAEQLSLCVTAAEARALEPAGHNY